MTEPRERAKDKYPGVAEAAAARKLGEVPVLTDEEIGTPTPRTLTPEEVASCNIDETYQRKRVDRMVDELSEVLKKGGVIADPVSIAVREDGSMWVVDGQQRYWAHLQEGKPMPSILFQVKNMDAEKRLFDILNNRVSLSGAVIIRAWPGRSKELLEWIDNSPKSPLRGRTGWGRTNPNLFKIEVVLSGLVALNTNTIHSQGVRARLIRLDAALKGDKIWPKVAAANYARLLNEMFPSQQAGMLRTPIAVALGRICFIRWFRLYERDATNWPFPTEAQIKELRLVNWSLKVPNSVGGVSEALKIIEELWPEKKPK